ncbi:hypothetical protein TWF281_007490 [Arthrobotrys megalospora]
MGSIKLLINWIFALSFYVWLLAGIPTLTLTQLDIVTRNGLHVIDGIQWTGPVAPGGENYTFFGDIEHIKRQIESTPGFDPSVFNVINSAIVDKHDPLMKRAGGTYNVECTRSSDPKKGAILTGYLVALKNLQDLHGSCSVTGPVCKRFSCKQDGSLGLCVTRKTPFNIECAEVARIAQILFDTMLRDFTGKVPNKCRILKGDKKSAIYYSGDVHWSLDGKWWFISAWRSSCLLQPWLTIPSPWPQKASDFIINP